MQATDTGNGVGGFLFPHDVPSVLHPAAGGIRPDPLKLEYKVVTSHFSQHDVIRRAQKLRREREKRQGVLIRDSDVWHESIRVKLSGLLESSQFFNFSRCGHDLIFRTCKSCKEQKQFTYRCSIKWCPRCNWRITKDRQEKLKEWMSSIEQPKHLVTTSRNTETLTSSMIKRHTQNLAALRRSIVFADVKGGCVTNEITNESKGWHLHSHWLVDARWVDAQALAVTWGKLVGQSFAVVKVMDLRSRADYAREIAKYVVKGGQMARWEPEEINEFVQAVHGKRFFFAFGTLFKAGAEIRARLEAAKPDCGCECGCRKFIFRSEGEQILHDHDSRKRKR